jgi:hypothetical protein
MVYVINGLKFLVEVPEGTRSLQEVDIDDRLIIR